MADSSQVHLANHNSLWKRIHREDGSRDRSAMLPCKLVTSLTFLVRSYTND